MSNYRLEFEIPGLPLPVNRQESMHWTRKREYVRGWHAQVAIAVGAHKPPRPLDRAKLTLTRYSSNEPDFDGLVSSFKPVLDGLIHCGVLVDDKPSNIGKSEYRWEHAKSKQGKIRVVVEEARPIPSQPRLPARGEASTPSEPTDQERALSERPGPNSEYGRIVESE